MSIETHRFQLDGEDILAVLDHAMVMEVLQVAGQTLPEIAPGTNTATREIVTAEGRFAIAFSQAGFARQAADDEREVNGFGLIIGQRLPPTEQTKTSVRRFLGHFLR